MQALRTLFIMTLLAGCASGCSRAGSSAATPPESTAQRASAISGIASASTQPGDGACALLSDAEVLRVFPRAAPGKRNTESLQYGLDRCAWKTPTGEVGVEVSKVEADAFENELRAELQGAVDPRVQGALDSLRFQPVAGIGDHAIAVLEKGDAKRGIYTDITLLAIQRNHRMAVLMIHDANLTAPALDTLKNLGRPLASRL